MRRVLFLYLLICAFGKLAFANQNTLSEIEEQIKTTRDSAALMNLYVQAGKIHFANADFVAAQKHFFYALRIAEKLNDEPFQGKVCNNIAASYMETEKYAEAEKYALKAIAIAAKYKNYTELGNAYNSLANVYYMQERDSLAFINYEQSIKNRKLANDSLGLFATLKNLGAIYYQTGDTLRAIEYMQQSLNYLTAQHDSTRWFSAYMTLSELYVYAGFL